MNRKNCFFILYCIFPLVQFDYKSTLSIIGARLHTISACLFFISPDIPEFVLYLGEDAPCICMVLKLFGFVNVFILKSFFSVTHNIVLFQTRLS